LIDRLIVIDDTAHARHRSSAATVHRRHELGRPVAAFLPICCSQVGSSFQVMQQQTVSSSRSITLLEGKEYGRDLMHCRQWLMSQRHVTVARATDLYSSIDEYQVN